MRRALLLVSLGAVLLAAATAHAAPTMRLSVALTPGARTSPHLLLLTAGGPVYCGQLRTLARNVRASLACTDYGPNRYVGIGSRAPRR